jgi:hypothetical protein
MYVPDPHRKVRRHVRPDDAARKARFCQPPERPAAFASKRAQYAWERLLYQWEQTPIPKGVTNTDVARWLWEEGQRVCPLCEVDIDIDLTNLQHPGRIELDHFQPRAWGGDHSWGNVRPTHRFCNQYRGKGDGTVLTFLPHQYRRAFGHALDFYKVPTKQRPIFEFRRRWVRDIESHLQSIEILELALEDPDEPHFHAWFYRLSREGPDEIRAAIERNRAAMVLLQAELDDMDRHIAEDRANGAAWTV